MYKYVFDYIVILKDIQEKNNELNIYKFFLISVLV